MIMQTEPRPQGPCGEPHCTSLCSRSTCTGKIWLMRFTHSQLRVSAGIAADFCYSPDFLPWREVMTDVLTLCVNY